MSDELELQRMDAELSWTRRQVEKAQEEAAFVESVLIEEVSDLKAQNAELLAALEGLFAIETKDYTYAQQDQAIEAARAAITKAKGETA